MIKRVKGLGDRDGKVIPAIAPTGYAGADDRLRATAAGYQIHMSKPVDLGTLTTEIARFVSESKS